MQARSVCFVIMPFGQKPDAAGHVIDFDAVFQKIIAPAVEAAGLTGVRADEEMSSGIIHKLMYERLLMAEFAVADLTILNANVYYELGIRHAALPASTVLMTAAGSRLPFDLGNTRALLYELDSNGRPKDAVKAAGAVRDALIYCAKNRATDSPFYQLLQGTPPPPIDHTKTDVFREQVAIAQAVKDKLREARGQGVAAVDAVRAELGDIEVTAMSVTMDLFLSYRAIGEWQRMVDLCKQMDPVLAQSVMVREQYAFALNRLSRSDEAEQALKDIIAQRGPSSETYGLLGRVYKDRWQAALKAGSGPAARGNLRQAIEAYRLGFEADWRDAYPGVNLVTLMMIEDPTNIEIANLAPVVRYAVERRIAARKGDYWDHATIVELAVMQNDWKRAQTALDDAVVAMRETWEADTTANNLRMIAAARKTANQDTAKLDALVEDLMAGKEHLAAKLASSAKAS
jgi:tetratricopeptide (TPR) repeat protein